MKMTLVNLTTDANNRPFRSDACSVVTGALKGLFLTTVELETGTLVNGPSDANKRHTNICIHHWLVDSPEAVCRCDGEPHYHAGCRLCLATRTFPAFLEPGPIAKAAMYAKRGARAKWKGRKYAEAPAK